MDREAFFSRKSKPTEITLDDDQVVKVRKLSQAEVETLRRKYASEEKSLEGYRYIVSRCVVDEDGRRVFEDSDQSKLTEIDFDVMSAIANEVMRLSGLTVAKNI